MICDSTANFPDGWVFKGTTCGTPGVFPEGADYGLGFQGKGPAYVVAYFSTALECEGKDSAKT